MSAFLNLPSPPLPPALRALQAAAARQEPNSGFSTNLRPVRHRLALSTAHPNPFMSPSMTPSVPCPEEARPPDCTTPRPPPQNETLLQSFEWYLPADGAHWARLRRALPALARLGVTRMWIPPACKAAGGAAGNGYDVYDLWDLGEFEQKGSARTKWGTKAELAAMAEEAARRGVGVLFDAVLGHKAGGDWVEAVRAARVDERDRRRRWRDGSGRGEEGEGEEIGAWTGFGFEGRRGRYSAMRWGKQHFKGVDWDEKRREKGVWKFEGKEWDEDVDEELGNYDFLMFADVDHHHPEVRADLFRWAEWLPTQLKLAGMRLDAMKHYSFRFQREFVEYIQTHVDPNWFVVGEYWREDSEFLSKFIEFMHFRISLFDVQLLSNFSRISLLGEKGDLRKVLDDALFLWKPNNTVTFVCNHDTQAGQPLETPIAPFFVPLAYALILLRADAGIPCVFYADLFGSFAHMHTQRPEPGRPTNPNSNFVPPTSGGAVLPKMMLARKLWAYGAQHDYFDDDPRCVGFTRLGHPSRSGGAGLAVVMTNAWECASKRMFVGKGHAGEVWTDLLRWCPGQVVIDADGWGVFSVGHRSVAVWVNAEAEGRDMVDSLVFDYDIYGFEAGSQKAESSGSGTTNPTPGYGTPAEY